MTTPTLSVRTQISGEITALRRPFYVGDLIDSIDPAENPDFSRISRRQIESTIAYIEEQVAKHRIKNNSLNFSLKKLKEIVKPVAGAST
jgi:hypothetical protein